MDVASGGKGQLSDQVAQAVDQIDHLIGRGRLVAGQRLIEKDLVELLGIGRVPVREALRILAGDGVVELIPNRGARVRSYSGRYIAQMLKALSALFCEGIEEFLESAQYEATMKRLVTLGREVSTCIEKRDLQGVFEASGRYQLAIFEASENTYLIELNRRVHFHHYNSQIVDVVGFPRLAAMAGVYEEVTAALLAKDGDQARRLIRERMTDILSVLMKSDTASRATGS